MEQVGARARHRVPILIYPAHQYGWGAFLLALTTGLILAGGWEAHCGGDTAWSIVFFVLAVSSVAMYFWQVACWLEQVSRSGD